MIILMSIFVFLTFPAMSATDYEVSIELLQQARTSKDIACWSRNIGKALTSLRSLKKEGDVRATEYLDKLANEINDKMLTACPDSQRNTYFSVYYDYTDVLNGYFSAGGTRVNPNFLKAIDVLDNDEAYKSYPGIRERCYNHLWRIVRDAL